MRDEDWDTVAAWLGAWSTADPQERQRLRTALTIEHPELIEAADVLSGASGRCSGFLETPAVILAAGAFADDGQSNRLPAGARLGPYRVVELLARGGMGEVYRAHDTRLHRSVALKVLSPSRSSDRQRLGRFMNEAMMTASLEHPNVVRVYDVGLVDDRAYLVAELLEGETLRARVTRGAMSADDVIRTGLEMTSGLAAAHAAGLVHRDLKPENVFLTQSGTAKILDFGIAKLAQDDTVRAGTSTLPGVVLGTAGYLAPEQIRGESVDARADLFALGAVLFEMLTGVRAFERPHIVETLHAILHDDPPDIVADRCGVPRALSAIVARLLEKSPDARFQTTTDVIQALEAIEVTAGECASVAAHRQPRPLAKASPRPGVRASLVWWALLVAVAFVAASIGIGVSFRPGTPATARRSPGVVLAVMPFRSLAAASDARLRSSGLNTSTDGLEAGLADVMISRLSRLPDVRVLPLTATERLAAQADSAEAARRVGVTHLLSGTLQREKGFVRATVQLVSTSDARIIWATPVDTDDATLFAIQDIVVARVLEAIAPQLTPGVRRALAQVGTRNDDAYDAYVRGRAYAARPAQATLTRAAELFERAVKLDPAYADAWAALGTVSRMLPLFDGVPVEGFVRAKQAAARALQLDPGHAEAYSVIGAVAFWHDWDYRESDRLLRRAVDLQPSATQSYVSLSQLLSHTGRHDEALVEIRRARALDQEWPLLRSLEGQFLFMARRHEDSLARLSEVVALEPALSAGHIMRTYPLIALKRYEEAIASCDQALSLNRSAAGSAKPHSFAAALRGYALARLGRTADAESALTSLREQAREQYVPPHHEALLLHALGRDRDALLRLRDAVDGRDLFVTFVGVDPKWDELRDHPEFRRLMARANLLDVSDHALR